MVLLRLSLLALVFLSYARPSEAACPGAAWPAAYFPRTGATVHPETEFRFLWQADGQGFASAYRLVSADDADVVLDLVSIDDSQTVLKPASALPDASQWILQADHAACRACWRQAGTYTVSENEPDTAPPEPEGVSFRIKTLAGDLCYSDTLVLGEHPSSMQWLDIGFQAPASPDTVRPEVDVFIDDPNSQTGTIRLRPPTVWKETTSGVLVPLSGVRQGTAMTIDLRLVSATGRASPTSTAFPAAQRLEYGCASTTTHSGTPATPIAALLLCAQLVWQGRQRRRSPPR